jgi:hypothetical protein
MSGAPIVRKIRSAKGSKPRNPEARFFHDLKPAVEALAHGIGEGAFIKREDVIGMVARGGRNPLERG